MPILTSLNWMMGTLLMLLALFWPWFENMQDDAQYVLVQTTVENVVKAQQNHRSIREEHVTFGSKSREMQQGFEQLGLAMPEDQRFLYETYRAPDGALVVRGRASPGHIMNDGFPPRSYSVRILPDGTVEKGRWSIEG